MNPFLMIFFNNLCSERILSQLLHLQKRKLCTFRDSVFEIPMPFSSTGSEYGRLKLKKLPFDMVKVRTAADVVDEKLFKHISKVLTEFFNKRFQKMKNKNLGCDRMHLKTKDDSYCFQIESSNCDKIQQHQKDF